MWRLIQDFFRQNWMMRAVLALGWLSILIMLTSTYVSLADLMAELADEDEGQVVDEVPLPERRPADGSFLEETET